MSSMLKSPKVLRLETLLRDAKVFVGRCTSIGAQQLSVQITETLAHQEPDVPHASEVEHALAVLRDAANSENPTLFWGEAMQHLRVLLADYEKVTTNSPAPSVVQMVSRFLAWPLPADVCADPCASIPDYPHRTGTNLLSAEQATAMLEHVLADHPTPDTEVPSNG